MLIGACTFAGVNGFHYDKTSGALELILVTPLDVGKIVFGRVRGLWKQFLPSMAVLVASNIAFNCVTDDSNGLWYRSALARMLSDNYMFVSLEIVIIYLTLPLVATCMALRFRKIVGASIVTGAMAFAPMLLLAGHAWLNESGPDSRETLLWFLTSPAVIILLQFFTKITAYGRVRRDLENRRFAL